MGGSPPGNDSIRSVKAFQRKAITTKRWPTTPEASPPITFSAEDAAGVHMPHNDSLLVDVGISDCTVTKVLEALTNALWINSKFRDYLGINPTITIEDALHDSKNFIKMDEDRRAYNAKQQALKPTASKTSNAQEPRQHAPYQKKGPVYAISEDDQSGVLAAVREPGWNVWERDTEGKTQQSRKPAPASSKGSYDQNKFCKYHDMRGHDTKECRNLYEAWLASTSDDRTEVEPPKPKTVKVGGRARTRRKSPMKREKKTPFLQTTATNRIMTRSHPPTKKNQKLGERFSQSEPRHPQRQTRRTIYVNHSTKK
ncbi:hypothetical protein F2Q68_00010998 [Brassica cretica]|uniref:Uncharacterized protein n=1 Tax=Brassica cretica TaxID=69181 RepID=A0A8S9L0L9_BRACR|nr:hypothetical protein F2Q68_00010998 [Brassica cretica]